MQIIVVVAVVAQFECKRKINGNSLFWFFSFIYYYFGFSSHSLRTMYVWFYSYAAVARKANQTLVYGSSRTGNAQNEISTEK